MGSPDHAGSPSQEHLPGRGCLLSLVLHPSLSAQAFFDALDTHKGPSLGTNFTLACPYTLLAHYSELPWAAQFGVHEGLIRVSVGCEPVEELVSIFSAALRAAEGLAATVV
eukprot:CAMPEP_0173237318 /NCGR_PEP_ID=MMETSP1142-20121109/11981_1 /TAXON_ID=483371 /ORGANISM="non described non described, Strain CCMP2298" /LENGTH=110 /DNA_ID=CAMNT_0014167989 /DNA_START=57 /DNA_END=385 /DNA_ORIENTATION=+